MQGSVASVIYPSGRTLNYDYFGSNSSSAGRLINLKDPSGVNYVTAAKYAPPGEATSFVNGAYITNTDAFSPRLQPIYLSAATSSATIISLCYDFHSAVALSSGPCSFTASAAGDNGNVFQIVNKRDNNRTQSFTYDALNRVQQASTTGNSPLTTSWGETFTIDPWGNLTNKGPVGGKTYYENLNASPANGKNQLNGFCHDAAGNLIYTQNCPPGPTLTYTYDAENRMISNPGATYVYDGDGNRVKKVGSTTTLYWFGATGDILTETDTSSGSVNDYAFFNGKRLARRDSSGNVHYYFSDHLGSASLITDAYGTMPPQSESDYYPYGGELPITADSTGNHYKFTGKERDVETCGIYCLDNFGARYDTSALGRFMTPDWASGKPSAVPYAEWSEPQSLNLYAYARNNPSSVADLDGHDPGDEFKTKVEAAVDAVKYIRKQGDGYKVEYVTRIHQNGKSFSYGPVVTQKDPAHADLPNLQKNDVGDVHNHNYRVGHDNDANQIEQPDRLQTISDKREVQEMQDTRNATVNYQSYVGAPNGDVMQFTPNSKAPDLLGDNKVVKKNVSPDPNPPKPTPPSCKETHNCN